MSGNRIVWDGLAEFGDWLRLLPHDVTEEAVSIVAARADTAADAIRADYPVRTGDLRDGVTVTHWRDRFVIKAIVTNTSKHAAVFENGSQARHTAIGANRGAMPPGNVFIPHIVRQRLAMVDDLGALLVRKGLAVSGDA